MNLILLLWALSRLDLGAYIDTRADQPPPAYTNRVEGVASWYQSGSRTACGNPFDPDDLTVALSAYHFSRSLCGAPIRITYGENVVTATITDRMPHNSRVVDLSRGTKNALGAQDLTHVTLEW